MTLAFPNPSRSFDGVRNAVRFMGHDGMFQIRFFVEAGALTKSDAAKREAGTLEAKCLSAFDALRMSIYARGLFARPPRFLHADCSTLTAADFR